MVAGQRVVVREAISRKHHIRHVTLQVGVIQPVGQELNQVIYLLVRQVQRMEVGRDVLLWHIGIIGNPFVEILNNCTQAVVAAAVEIEGRVLHIIDVRHFEFEHVFRSAGEPSSAEVANVVRARIETTGFVKVSYADGVEFHGVQRASFMAAVAAGFGEEKHSASLFRFTQGIFVSL